MITKKLLTDDLKLSRSKGKVHLKYKDKQLAVIAESVLFQLLLDASPASFIHDLAKIAGIDTPKSEVPEGVKKIATVYAYEKLKYLGKKPASTADPKVVELVETLLKDKKIVADFKRAIATMRQAEVKNITAFIQAQVDGLKFVNGGQGTFPKPSQLGTAQALDRVLGFVTVGTPLDTTAKSEKPKHYWFFNKETDGNLSLSENSKYQSVISRIKEGVATLDECIYASKCYANRRQGKTYSLIENYIKKISK